MKINPNKIKSRDLVHLQEITHGSGAGAHKNKKKYNRKQARKEEKGEPFNLKVFYTAGYAGGIPAQGAKYYI